MAWDDVVVDDVTVDYAADHNNMISQIKLRALIASPTFTGVPAADTAAVGTNTTQLATCAFVLANSAPDSNAKVIAYMGF